MKYILEMGSVEVLTLETKSRSLQGENKEGMLGWLHVLCNLHVLGTLSRVMPGRRPSMI